MSSYDDLARTLPRTFSVKPILSLELIERIKRSDFVDDIEFDVIFPAYYGVQSTIHWSPIEVAQQISEWIRSFPDSRFIDIGCGVGKLCILLSFFSDLEINGIEQRPNLVNIANEIISANSLKNVSVFEMNMMDLDWESYDIYYLYNPFQEQISDESFYVIDRDVELGKKNYAQYTTEVFRQLSWAKSGKVLITFHGYGGSIPPDWRLVTSKRIQNGNLTMWIKD